MHLDLASSSGNTTRGRHAARLRLVLGLTMVFLGVEVAAGLLTGSLALLADAGHMLTDAGGIALALVAIRFAGRPATPTRTYGFHRLEILAAAANALLLIGVSLFILYEAYGRLFQPPAVATLPMLGVAIVGLLVNLAGIALLRGDQDESLNVKGAYFEVLSDTLSSAAVIATAGAMWATRWYWLDPLISAAIGLFILPRTWTLLREAIGVLLEGTPPSVDLDALREALCTLPGVRDVHDLHVWTLTSGLHAMSAHVVRAPDASTEDVLARAQACVTSRFAIDHATLQVEPPDWEEGTTHR